MYFLNLRVKGLSEVVSAQVTDVHASHGKINKSRGRAMAQCEFMVRVSLLTEFFFFLVRFAGEELRSSSRRVRSNPGGWCEESCHRPIRLAHQKQN